MEQGTVLAGSSDIMQECDGCSGIGGSNREIATYDGDGGMGTGSRDNGGRHPTMVEVGQLAMADR